jgi:hypothetical protein
MSFSFIGSSLLSTYALDFFTKHPGIQAIDNLIIEKNKREGVFKLERRYVLAEGNIECLVSKAHIIGSCFIGSPQIIFTSKDIQIKGEEEDPTIFIVSEKLSITMKEPGRIENLIIYLFPGATFSFETNHIPPFSFRNVQIIQLDPNGNEDAPLEPKYNFNSYADYLQVMHNRLGR